MNCAIFAKRRIKVQLVGTKPVLRDPGWKSGLFEGRRGLWNGMDGENATVVFGVRDTLNVPPKYIATIEPSVKGEEVSVINGTSLGEKFSLMSNEHGQCTVRRIGKTGKANTFTFSITDLASSC